MLFYSGLALAIAGLLCFFLPAPSWLILLMLSGSLLMTMGVLGYRNRFWLEFRNRRKC